MKLIARSTIVFLFMGVCSLAYADTLATSKNVVATLPVSSIFGFTIWDTEFNRTLPAVNPGQSRLFVIHVSFTSNHSIPFNLNAQCAGLVGQTQAVPDTLPVNMTTVKVGALNGTTVSGLLLTGAVQTIYTGVASDVPCSGKALNAISIISTSALTKQDTYTGTIVLTMTE